MSNDPRVQAAVAAGTVIGATGGLITAAGVTTSAAPFGPFFGRRFTLDAHTKLNEARTGSNLHWDSARKSYTEILESYLDALNAKETGGQVQVSKAVQNFQTDSGQNVAQDNAKKNDDDTQEFGQLRSNQHPRTKMGRERRLEYHGEQGRYLHEYPENTERASGAHGQDTQASSPQYPPTNMRQSSYDIAQGSQHVDTQRYTFGTICESPISFEGPSFANFQQHTLGNYANFVHSDPHLRTRPSNDPAALSPCSEVNHSI